MFSRILVPLDGSRLAESALPAAKALQLAFGSSITLIHVLERSAPSEAHGERHLRDLPDAESYLEEISKRFPERVKIERHVHTGGISDVSSSLTEHSRELDQDLIIMCVHGRGGIARVVEGSLAERIMEKQAVPVLLVRAGTDAPFSRGIRTVLAALDGNPDHDQGLPVAQEIASKTGAGLILATIVPTWFTLMGEKGATGRFLPAATAELLAQSEESAGRYLGERAEKLAAQGIATETVVRRGNPPRQIAYLAREKGADLIVLGTHGRAGTKAFWAGSTAHRIIGGTCAPLLLVPAGRDVQ
jgi:nucleotide-binding universal stress UspA family protein